jgi:hypothetical protein
MQTCNSLCVIELVFFTQARETFEWEETQKLKKLKQKKRKLADGDEPSEEQELEPVPEPMTQQKNKQKEKPRYDTEIGSDEEMIPVCGDKSMLRKIHLNQRGLRPTHTDILFDADV